VLDFYCPELKLCVEVDGAGHELRLEADAARDAWLATQGIRTIRLAAKDVLADVSGA
jgi:very-short-patch-repair endonuclease